MLISALCDFYDVLARDGKVLPEGYSDVDVRYLISITSDGIVDDIIDWQIRENKQDKNGKVKTIEKPRKIRLPKRTQKTGIDGNYIEHRPEYIFGICLDNGVLKVNESSKKKHEVFKKTNIEFIEGIDSPIVNAYRHFIAKWSPESETNNLLLSSNLGNRYATSNFAFCLSGRPDILLHNDPKIIERWEQIKSQRTDENAVFSQCAITGEQEKISKIHNKIRGFVSTGSVLINFNNPSESSYGKEQSYNSNISEKAMEKYTEALNYLLTDQKHKTQIGDVSVVHWAASGDENCSELFRIAIDTDRIEDAEKIDTSIKYLMNKVAVTRIRDKDFEDFKNKIDESVNYYIVGMKPNSSRIAVKFIYRRKFGEIIGNIAAHQNDLKFSDEDKTLSLQTLVESLGRPEDTNKNYNPAGITKLLEAIICGYNYPDYLLTSALRRIRIDDDTKYYYGISYNDIRKRIIKAYINRKSRLSGKKEEIKMSLDRENKNPAYLCGRLFAVLEGIQKENSSKLNRTIRDAYFSSASTYPATTFPKIMRLAQHHLTKIGNPKYCEDLLFEIMSGLDNHFPTVLNLTQQGIFMIGYYQQKAAKKAETENYFANKNNDESEKN